jgi:hypothetical protein
MSDQFDPVDCVRRLDPVDGEQLATEWSISDAKTALFQEITTMPVETPSKTRTVQRPAARRRAVLVAALAIAGLVVAVPGVLPGPDTAAYAVRHLPDGLLEVSWDGDLDGEALAATLREYDVDVRVETEPVSPSMVGQVSGLGPLEQQGNAVFEWGANASETESSFTLDPTAFSGTFYLLIDRAAEPGERYAAAAEAFTPGEVLSGLQCSVDLPLRSEVLAAHLDRLGQTAVWNVVDVSSSDAVPQGEVLNVHAIDAETVDVMVRLDGDTTPADPSPYLTPGHETHDDSCAAAGSVGSG